MNFTELLEHSNVNKSVIDDFEGWLFHLKDIKGYSENTYHSYCYDICDFLIFYQFYHQEPLSHGILQNLNLQTFRAWVADMAAPREYNNVYKKPLSARSRRRSISSLKSFLKFSSSKIEGYKFGYAEIQLLKNPKMISDSAKNISGVIIGFISVLLGIGGGSLMVPFMRTFGYDIRRSIGTAAGVGFLIAVFGTITMITGGKIVDNINTPYSLGYVNLLGFLVFVPVTMIMARVGAKAVYKIDKNILSKIFGIFLIIVSIRSFFEYLSIN